jgi:hypothetical protein
LARPLYATEPFGVELDTAVYAFDVNTIDLCLSVFAWAPFRSTKTGIKLRTLLELRANITSFILQGSHVVCQRRHHFHRRGIPSSECW